MPWTKISNGNRPFAGDRVLVRWHDGPRECLVTAHPLQSDKRKSWVVKTQSGGKCDVQLRAMTEVWREEEEA